MSNKSDQYVIYLKQCFLSLYYKKITACRKVSVDFFFFSVEKREYIVVVIIVNFVNKVTLQIGARLYGVYRRQQFHVTPAI